MYLVIFFYYFRYYTVTNYNKLGDLKTTEIYPPTAPEARSPKTRCGQGHILSEGSRERPFLASSQLLAVPGNLRHSLACGCITLISASTFTWPSCKDTSHWI